MRVRCHGGLAFADLREGSQDLQVMVSRDDVDRAAAEDGRPETFDVFKRLIGLGDLVAVSGQIVTTKTGELTVAARSWQLAAKSLKPLPTKRGALTSPELRLRLRHIELATSAKAQWMLKARAVATRAMRVFLTERGFLEVETPMLQAIHGGANARPFRTHINAYDAELYLRIAPELALKRLLVGGEEKIFELGRNFRNEGADWDHNPEFTSLEAYQVFADYLAMRELTRELIIAAAIAVHGEPVAIRPDGSKLDIGGPWRSVTVHAAVADKVGEPVTVDTGLADLRRIAGAHAVHFQETMTAGEIVSELYDALVEGATDAPTFYMDFPVETSPLTRPGRRDPRIAERWDLVAFGAELGTAYSELSDPVDQRERLTEQSLRAAAGDPEAMEIDEDFLTALEFGMPPTGGLGIGVDRIVMTLTGASIRETLAFPFARPAPR
jgi:lysyl-tRNA synthetase class 2